MNGWMVGCSIGLICFCACFLSSLHSIHSPFQISSWYPFVDLFLLQGIQSQWYCKAQSSVLSQRRSKQMTPAWLFTLPPLGLWIFNRLRCGQEKWLGCIYFNSGTLMRLASSTAAQIPWFLTCPFSKSGSPMLYPFCELTQHCPQYNTLLLKLARVVFYTKKQRILFFIILVVFGCAGSSLRWGLFFFL